jgi:hypothetical protein
MSLRSKSQASHHDQASISQRVAGLRRPRGASPSSIGAAEPSERAGLRLPDTRDSATQTLKARTSPAGDELSPTRDLEGPTGERRSEFLFGPIQLQSELGMAIQAALEFTAERRITHSYSPSEFAAIRGLGGEDGSDDETLENLEVRSLSLSEDGPMIARTFSERQRMTAAPDPIAMLTHGQQHAGDLEPKHKEHKEQKEQKDKEQTGSSGHGSTDLSAAGTENAPGGSGSDAQAESHEQSLCRNLLPILLPIFEKTAELSASDPAGDSAAGTTYQQRFSTRSGPPPTKVRVKSSRARGRTLDLAELQTAGRRGDAALANLASASSPDGRGFVAVRSEFSLGSEHSAFTSVSSPSSQGGSKDSTPRGRSGLRGVASMPTLQQHRGGARSVG